MKKDIRRLLPCLLVLLLFPLASCGESNVYYNGNAGGNYNPNQPQDTLPINNNPEPNNSSDDNTNSPSEGDNGTTPTVQTPGDEYEDFEFQKYQNGYALTAYYGDEINVSIPTEFKGKNVLSIGTAQNNYSIVDGFYKNTRIKTVVLPKYIERIAYGSFAGCTSLENVVFQDIDAECFIESYAFSGTTKLKSFTIGKKTTIGYGIFENSGIQELFIKRSITNSAYFYGLMLNCSSLKKVVLSGSSYVFESNYTNTFFAGNNIEIVEFTTDVNEVSKGILNGAGKVKKIISNQKLFQNLEDYYKSDTLRKTTLNLNIIDDSWWATEIENIVVSKKAEYVDYNPYYAAIVASGNLSNQSITYKYPSEYKVESNVFVIDGVKYYLVDDDYSFSYNYLSFKTDFTNTSVSYKVPYRISGMFITLPDAELIIKQY